MLFIVFVKQKTAYEMRISDWSSDVCSSDLRRRPPGRHHRARTGAAPYRAAPGLRRLMSRCFQCDSPVSPAGRCQCAHNRESEPMSNKCHGCGRRPTACQCYAALSLRSDNLVGQPFDFRMGLTGRREHREAVMVTASAPSLPDDATKRLEYPKIGRAHV